MYALLSMPPELIYGSSSEFIGLQVKEQFLILHLFLSLLASIITLEKDNEQENLDDELSL